MFDYQRYRRLTSGCNCSRREDKCIGRSSGLTLSAQSIEDWFTNQCLEKEKNEKQSSSFTTDSMAQCQWSRYDWTSYQMIRRAIDHQYARLCRYHCDQRAKSIDLISRVEILTWLGDA